jgi:hypothetical protein
MGMFLLIRKIMVNSVPAHSYHGKPVGGYRLSSVAGAKLAAASGPYIGRGNKCTANDDTCEGMKAKGTDLCMGHLRSAAKEVAQDVSDKNDSE